MEAKVYDILKQVIRCYAGKWLELHAMYSLIEAEDRTLRSFSDPL